MIPGIRQQIPWYLPTIPYEPEKKDFSSYVQTFFKKLQELKDYFQRNAQL